MLKANLTTDLFVEGIEQGTHNAIWPPISTESMWKPNNYIFRIGFKIVLSDCITKSSLESKQRVVLTHVGVSDVAILKLPLMLL